MAVNLARGFTKEKTMTKIALGVATAAILGLAAFSAPANAVPAAQLGAANASHVVDVQYRRHRKVCTVRTVVSRSHGHRVVRKIRSCR
jgi:hypothetical protein